MLQETHPLIKAAIKPLGQNSELKYAAIAHLGETTDPKHPATAESLKRWADIDSSKHPNAWKWITYFLAAIAAVTISILAVPEILAVYSSYQFFSLFTISKTTPPHLTHQQSLLLGIPGETPLRQKELLLQSDPNRPDFYAEYVDEYIKEYQKLPEDYFETIKKIDPENAFFVYIAAGLDTQDSVKRISRTAAERKSGQARRYNITDPARFESSLGLIHQAGKLPRFDSYQASMSAARIPLIKGPGVIGRNMEIGYMSSLSASHMIRLRLLSDVISAKAIELADAGDLEGFKELAANNEHLLRLWAESPLGYLVGELVFKVICADTSESLSHAAAKLGLEEEEARLEKRHDSFKRSMEARHLPSRDRRASPIFKRGGYLHGLTFPALARQLEKEIPISEVEMRPGRLADHDFAASVFTMTVMLLLVIAWVLVCLFRFRAPYYIRTLAGRFGQLLTPRDWLKILGLGVAMPIATILLINRFTPLGGRDYSLSHFVFIFPAVHYITVLLSVFIVPLLIINRRLAEKTAAFHLPTPRFWFDLPAVFICSALPLIAFPIASAGLDLQITLPIMAWIAVILLLLIALAASRALFGKRQYRLSRAIAADALLPAFALAIILLAATYPAISLSANNWLERDTLMKPDEKYPAANPYEYKVTQQVRLETNRILGFSK